MPLKKDKHLGQSLISGHTPVRLSQGIHGSRKGLICRIRSSAGKTEEGSGAAGGA